MAGEPGLSLYRYKCYWDLGFQVAKSHKEILAKDSEIDHQSGRKSRLDILTNLFLGNLQLAFGKSCFFLIRTDLTDFGILGWRAPVWKVVVEHSNCLK
jgi:hypothetical protein